MSKKFPFYKQPDSKDCTQQPYNYSNPRNRIETLFSQACEQFRNRNNYIKTFEGIKTTPKQLRTSSAILAKITALPLVHYTNRFIFDRPMNHSKN